MHSCSSFFVADRTKTLVFQNEINSETVKILSEHIIDTVLCVFNMLHSKDTLENNSAA